MRPPEPARAVGQVRRGPPTLLARPPLIRPGLPGVILLGTIVVGALIRFSAASHGGLWRDEALFLFVSRIHPFSKLLDFLRLHESHPPGFYVLMRWWAEIMGHSESAAVGLSLLFGIALIPLAYFVASRLFTWRMGLFVAALVALSPPLIQLSILVRPYAMLAFLSLLSTYFLWECLRGRGGAAGMWAAYGVTSVMLLYTHNWTLLVICAQGLVGLLWIGRRPSAVRRPLWRPWLLTYLAVTVCYLPWIPALLYQFRHAGHGPRPDMSLGLYILTAKVLAGANLYLVVPLMALAGLSGWLSARTRGKVELAPGATLGVVMCAGIPLLVLATAVALSSRTNLLPPWCVAVMSPLVLLVVARLLAWVLETGAWREAYLSGGLLLLLYGSAWHYDRENLKSNARETALAVARRATPGDLVIVTPETLASSFNFYFRPRNPQIDYPSLRREEIVRYDDRFERLTSEDALAQALARIDTAYAHGRRVWFVMEADDMADGLVRPLEANDTARGYIKPLVLKRSNQIRQHLIRTYGQPSLRLMPSPRDQALELLGALLFEPETSTASLASRTSCEVTLQAGRPGDNVPAPPPLPPDDCPR